MASSVQCQYKLSMVKEQDRKPDKQRRKTNLEDGHMKVVFPKIETKFMLRTRQPELEGVSAADVFIDKETFDDSTYALDVPMINSAIWWMTRDQARGFGASVLDFARKVAARPENANLKQIQFAVDFWVYTVQQENESYEEAMNKATRARHGVPPSDATKLHPHNCAFVSCPESFA